jgi:hypothetical protein
MTADPHVGSNVGINEERHLPEVNENDEAHDRYA